MVKCFASPLPGKNAVSASIAAGPAPYRLRSSCRADALPFNVRVRFPPNPWRVLRPAERSRASEGNRGAWQAEDDEDTVWDPRDIHGQNRGVHLLHNRA